MPNTLQKHIGGSKARLLSRPCSSTNPRLGKVRMTVSPSVAPATAAEASPLAAAGTAVAPSTGVPRPAIRFDKVKGVLFDIDGTLTNSDPLHFIAFQEILQEIGFQEGRPIDEDFFRKHISGRHNPEIAAGLLPHWSEERRMWFYETKEERFRQLAGSVLKPLPGLQQFMQWVDGGKRRKAAVTNAPRANTYLMLSVLNLEDYFEIVVLGEECTRAKPFPDPYLQALACLELQPSEALVVEDSPAGITAAVAAGVPVVGLTTGQPAAALLAAGASLIVSDFEELMQAIQQQQQQQQQQH